MQQENTMPLGKMWSGRFSKDSAKIADALNFSIGFDHVLYDCDIAVSIAHAKMLGRTGIIPASDADLIVRGLEELRDDWQTVDIPADAEDIHMAIEALLTARIGEPGKRLHTARSRNDQVATTFRLFLFRRANDVAAALNGLLDVLQVKSAAYPDVVMPAYTHTQRAQPTTLANHLGAYVEMFNRDGSRLDDWYKRANECPLGSGACVGTTLPIDREYTAQLLGFDRPTANTLDAVSDRDFVIELLSVLALIQLHMSRLCEEIVLWSSWEFGFIELDDSFATGSSMMPQKKNPDVAEHIRGKTGRVYGSLVTMLTAMKALPLAYNGDMQEDKESAIDALTTVELCLRGLSGMLETATFKTERMRDAASVGFLNATELAERYVKQGVPFRTAHELVGKAVAEAIARGDRTIDTDV